MTLKLGDIVAKLGGELHGDPDTVIDRLAPLDSAQPGHLSFLSNPKYRQQLSSTHASCVIVAPAIADDARARGSCIVAADPYHYFAQLTRLWRESGRPLLTWTVRSPETRARGVAHADALIAEGAGLE